MLMDEYMDMMEKNFILTIEYILEKSTMFMSKCKGI